MVNLLSCEEVNYREYLFTTYLKSNQSQSSCIYSFCFIGLILPTAFVLTHWGRVTHICVGNLTIIGSDNGLSPGRRQAITWTNVGILFIGALATNFSEMLIKIHTFSFKKIHLNMSSGKWWPFCLGLNVLTGMEIRARITDIHVNRTM